MTTSTVPVGWYGDPYRGGSTLRHWDGSRWTDHVSINGSTSADPIGSAPQLPPPAVMTPRPLSPETVAANRRADLVRRWVIALAAIAVGVYFTAIALKLV